LFALGSLIPTLETNGILSAQEWFVISLCKAADFWMRVEVDKRYPARWREEPYYTEICQPALDGVKSEKFGTMVRVGDDRFLVLGRRIIKNPPSGRRLVQTATYSIISALEIVRGDAVKHR